MGRRCTNCNIYSLKSSILSKKHHDRLVASHATGDIAAVDREQDTVNNQAGCFETGTRENEYRKGKANPTTKAIGPTHGQVRAYQANYNCNCSTPPFQATAEYTRHNNTANRPDTTPQNTLIPTLTGHTEQPRLPLTPSPPPLSLKSQPSSDYCAAAFRQRRPSRMKLNLDAVAMPNQPILMKPLPHHWVGAEAARHPCRQTAVPTPLPNWCKAVVPAATIAAHAACAHERR